MTTTTPWPTIRQITTGLACLVATLGAVPCQAGPSLLDPCPEHFEAEGWLNPQTSFGGLSLSHVVCPNPLLAFRIGVSSFTESGLAFNGGNVSARLHLGSPISVYVGLGAIGGMNERDVPTHPSNVYATYNPQTNSYTYKERTYTGHLFQEVGFEIYTSDRGIAFGIKHDLSGNPPIQGQRVLSMSVLFVH